MYCRNCGSQLDDNAVVCPHCGVSTGVNNNYYSRPIKKKYNIMALIGFALSFFIAIAGLVCSVIGYKQADEYNGDGKNFAIAGIVISITEIVLSFLLVVFCVLVFIGVLGAV